MKFRYAMLIGSLLAAAPAPAHDCHGYGHHDYDWHGCVDCGGPALSAQPRSAPIQTLKGTISEISHTAGAVQAWVKASGATILVRLGPAEFLRQNGVSLAGGDTISVKGYLADSPDGDLLFATEIEAAGKILLLRTSRGKPLW